MNEFSASIMKGLTAAAEAERDKAEIAAVIKRLSVAIEETTNGKVKVIRQTIPAILTTTSVVEALAQIGGSSQAVRRIDTLSLQSANKSTDKHEIARLDIPPSGYPCVVIRGANRETCYDEKSLVAALQELLESPEVGKLLAKLQEDADPSSA